MPVVGPKGSNLWIVHCDDYTAACRARRNWQHFQLGNFFVEGYGMRTLVLFYQEPRPTRESVLAKLKLVIGDFDAGVIDYRKPKPRGES